MSETIRRYFVFFLSVILAGSGVAVISLSSAGTTPISSFPLEVAVHWDFTLGQTTVMLNVCFLVAEYFLLPSERRNTRESFVFLALQLPTVLVMAFTIDIMMWTGYQLIPAALLHSYLVDICNVFIGSILIALGITLEVIAAAAMMPGEGFVKLLAERIRRDFGRVKLAFDLTLVLAACVTGLLATSFTYVASVREGTLISALIIGPMIQFVMPRFGFVGAFIAGRRRDDEPAHPMAPAATGSGAEETAPAPAGCVITISREFGTGGHSIGRRVAGQLGIEFYDKELVEMIAQESGHSVEYVEHGGQVPEHGRLLDLILRDYSGNLGGQLSDDDILFVATARVIRQVASRGPCVIVGRCADQVLCDRPGLLSFHIFASHEYKLRYCQEHYSMLRQRAEQHMAEVDRQRAEFYRQYTGHNLSDPRNYCASLDVSRLGEEHIVELICALYAAAQKAPAAAAAPAAS